MTKEEIRRTFKQQRRRLSEAEKDTLEDLMLIQFQKLKLPNVRSLMTYAPIEAQNEFNPYLIEEYCLLMHEHSVLVFPIIDFKNDVIYAKIVHEEQFFEANRYGIEEPTGGIKIDPNHIDAMLVPLLAFDKKGNRVGYGKGYYDKFIKNCNPDMVKIGFSFFEPVEIDDIDEWDQRLDYCITPKKIYKF